MRTAKWAGTLMLAVSLSACVDAAVDIELTGADTARATVTQDMSADFYAMMKMNAEDGEAREDHMFCANGALSEHADGSATCTIVEQGRFADLAALGEGDNGLTFTPAGPGLVRIGLPMDDMRAEIGADKDLDAETRQMIEALFAGHAITISISGGEITDTNMTLAEDGESARAQLPFLDLINGTVELPSEFFAVVRVP